LAPPKPAEVTSAVRHASAATMSVARPASVVAISTALKGAYSVRQRSATRKVKLTTSVPARKRKARAPPPMDAGAQATSSAKKMLTKRMVRLEMNSSCCP
jgi:hypothetical protein